MKENLSCEDCERELIALIDGTLTPAVARVVENHAASCESCGRSLQIYRFQAGRLRMLSLMAAPAGLEDAVVRQVLGVRRFLRWGWQRIGAAAGAISFALSIALLVNLSRVTSALGVPDPYVWIVSALDHSITTLTNGSKWLASEVTVYVPLVRQLWLATQALGTIPRAALILLRTPEVQVAGVVLITLALALFFRFNPFRRHEGSVGHVCLSL